MHENINQAVYEQDLLKYRQLNLTQAKLFEMYGLRQIKYMVEEDLNQMEELPEGAVLLGLNVMGRWMAINEKERIRYGYFRASPEGERWSEANLYFMNNQSKHVYDAVEDFKKIYEIFELGNRNKEDLTYYASNFMLVLEKQIHPFAFIGGSINLTKDI
jgi:hypothetical protein